MKDKNGAQQSTISKYGFIILDKVFSN